MADTLSQFQTNNRFSIAFSKLPKVSLYAQRVSLPGISISHTKVGTPFSFINEPDTKPQYSDLMIQFKLDENFETYLEIFNWLNGLAFPESFDQYNTVGRANTFGDATVNIYTNSSNPNFQVTYYNVSPSSLGEVQLASDVADFNYIDMISTFKFDYYRIKPAT